MSKDKIKFSDGSEIEVDLEHSLREQKRLDEAARKLVEKLFPDDPNDIEGAMHRLSDVLKEENQ